MNAIQVGDGLGGPLEWANPIDYRFVPGECRNFLLERAGYTDRVGVACRRLLYCFKLSGKGQILDYHNINQEETRILILQKLLFAEHKMALRNFRFTNRDHDMIFPHIEGMIDAFLTNIGADAGVIDTKTFGHHGAVLVEDAMDKVSHTIMCKKLEINLAFNSPHTLILTLSNVDDHHRSSLVGCINPFKLKSLVVQSGSRRFVFKQTTVMWIVQDQSDSEKFIICLRNTRETVVMGKKGSEPYSPSRKNWTTSEQTCFIKNNEIAEKVFEKRYLGEDSQKEDKVLDGLV